MPLLLKWLEKQGTVSLPAGEYEVSIKADQLNGAELMRLYEITMQPK
ncbi:hypothetical protein CLV51_10294 [Chitinophaga niastensis]|uniref:Uncharacterized protein n=1 Tax=Chitinophaga niastensis TaxID=536980 RepID=A0A2P8HM20_CHINA|nr:hypothetical protein [Chitinophaga niastensis]PSL47249.1 hypothetical protein CLV51_10294 [Chitinophaga niastensis]